MHDHSLRLRVGFTPDHCGDPSRQIPWQRFSATIIAAESTFDQITFDQEGRWIEL